MSWCPKCKREYEVGLALCPECGWHLVDEDPAPPRDSPSFHSVLEIAAVSAIIPLMLYLSIMLGVFVVFSPFMAATNPFAASILLLLFGMLPVAIPIVYGYRRRFRLALSTLLYGYIGSLLLLITLGYAVSFSVSEPWKLIVLVLFGGVISAATLILVWFGSILRPKTP